MYKALSKFFINKLILGEVLQGETQLLQIFNIGKFPTLMVVIEEEKINMIYITEKSHMEMLKNI